MNIIKAILIRNLYSFFQSFPLVFERRNAPAFAPNNFVHAAVINNTPPLRPPTATLSASGLPHRRDLQQQQQQQQPPPRNVATKPESRSVASLIKSRILPSKNNNNNNQASVARKNDLKVCKKASSLISS